MTIKKIKIHLINKDKTIDEFAKEIGASTQAMYQWISGKRIPRKAFILKMQIATDNFITANDFINNDN